MIRNARETCQEYSVNTPVRCELWKPREKKGHALVNHYYIKSLNEPTKLYIEIMTLLSINYYIMTNYIISNILTVIIMTHKISAFYLMTFVIIMNSSHNCD